MRSRGLVAALIAGFVALLSAAKAHADDLTPEQFSKEDSGKESDFHREGFAIGVALGPALLLGAGSQNDVRGTGGDLSIRVGTSAGPDLLWFAQIGGATHSDKSTVSSLSIQAHYYVRRALWLRGGLGFGTVTRFDTAADGNANAKKNDTGLEFIGGGGVDVFTRGIFAIDVELSISRSGHDQGSMTVGALQVAANWY